MTQDFQDEKLICCWVLTEENIFLHLVHLSMGQEKTPCPMQQVIVVKTEALELLLTAISIASSRHWHNLRYCNPKIMNFYYSYSISYGTRTFCIAFGSGLAADLWRERYKYCNKVFDNGRMFYGSIYHRKYSVSRPYFPFKSVSAVYKVGPGWPYANSKVKSRLISQILR